jgi:hypothetical protein
MENTWKGVFLIQAHNGNKKSKEIPHKRTSEMNKERVES